MEKKQPEKKAAPILVQMGIFAAILFVSALISSLFPKSFVVPTPLIGMIILYILLATHIVKLEQVEKFGDLMISLIAFMFVPSGVQLAGSLDLMKREGLQDIIVSVLATIIILVVIAYVGALVIKIHQKLTGRVDDDEETEKGAN
ncbi:CidA/LrgA family protein [Limosilactobacillus ingluviei]|uniref:Murein hydrolase regulator LrgA n=2 Tax=Limosilactobacillus ingluviei TaxID=148604 RepID=A0A0R2GTK6_9LACO|nr:CidA/LrgA family protein [Limosilactobacillus ingluviei]KRL87836.1 murein hydrolase regulator LrgA [Limosilactobacillus ingluviei DSM 15946]KRN43880.1 murein hydrolase regulator LrgA [Limosilactobacillus ingluviei]MBM6728104.1 CidA/LrgA family protein [Limosilactobacillus ingluviei]